MLASFPSSSFSVTLLLSSPYPYHFIFFRHSPLPLFSVTPLILLFFHSFSLLPLFFHSYFLVYAYFTLLFLSLSLSVIFFHLSYFFYFSVIPLLSLPSLSLLYTSTPSCHSPLPPPMPFLFSSVPSCPSLLPLSHRLCSFTSSPTPPRHTTASLRHSEGHLGYLETSVA